MLVPPDANPGLSAVTPVRLWWDSSSRRPHPRGPGAMPCLTGVSSAGAGATSELPARPQASRGWVDGFHVGGLWGRAPGPGGTG